jgi:hypothetical protein
MGLANAPEKATILLKDQDTKFTLYHEQWIAILDRSDAIREFVVANAQPLNSNAA